MVRYVYIPQIMYGVEIDWFLFSKIKMSIQLKFPEFVNNFNPLRLDVYECLFSNHQIASKPYFYLEFHSQNNKMGLKPATHVTCKN